MPQLIEAARHRRLPQLLVFHLRVNDPTPFFFALELVVQIVSDLSLIHQIWPCSRGGCEWIYSPEEFGVWPTTQNQ